jgi:protein-disulfide isomerase
MEKLLIMAMLAAAASAAGPDPIKGKTAGVATAPVRVDVFSDYQCPSCKRLYEEAVVPMMTDYVNKGKVFFIHREFPLTSHAHARQAAAYATAATRVGKYEQVCAALFRQQQFWSQNGQVDAAVASALTPDELKKVRTLINTKEIAAEVDSDVNLGKLHRVNQTPTMIITHKGKTYPVAGTVNYGLFRRFLDDLLSK